MKKLLALVSVMVMCATAHAGFEGLNEGSSLAVFNRINCKSGIQCSKGSKGMMDIEYTGEGVLQNRAVASATTITAEQCGGTFINSGAVQIELPEASAVLGCRLTFITANASNFDVNPDDADQILVQTNAAGDSIRNATLGNSITIEAISASQWAPVAVVGTWSDND